MKESEIVLGISDYVLDALLKVCDTYNHLIYLNNNSSKKLEDKTIKTARSYFKFTLIPQEKESPILKKFRENKEGMDNLAKQLSVYLEGPLDSLEKMDIYSNLKQKDVYSYIKGSLESFINKLGDSKYKELLNNIKENFATFGTLYYLAPEYVSENIKIESPPKVDLDSLSKNKEFGQEILNRLFPDSKEDYNSYEFQEGEDLTQNAFVFPLLNGVKVKFVADQDSTGSLVASYRLECGEFSIEIPEDKRIQEFDIENTCLGLINKTETEEEEIIVSEEIREGIYDEELIIPTKEQFITNVEEEIEHYRNRYQLIHDLLDTDRSEKEIKDLSERFMKFYQEASASLKKYLAGGEDTDLKNLQLQLDSTKTTLEAKPLHKVEEVTPLEFDKRPVPKNLADLTHKQEEIPKLGSEPVTDEYDSSDKKLAEMDPFKYESDPKKDLIENISDGIKFYKEQIDVLEDGPLDKAKFEGHLFTGFENFYKEFTTKLQHKIDSIDPVEAVKKYHKLVTLSIKLDPKYPSNEFHENKKHKKKRKKSKVKGNEQEIEQIVLEKINNYSSLITFFDKIKERLDEKEFTKQLEKISKKFKKYSQLGWLKSDYKTDIEEKAANCRYRLKELELEKHRKQFNYLEEAASNKDEGFSKRWKKSFEDLDRYIAEIKKSNLPKKIRDKILVNAHKLGRNVTAILDTYGNESKQKTPPPKTVPESTKRNTNLPRQIISKNKMPQKQTHNQPVLKKDTKITEEDPLIKSIYNGPRPKNWDEFSKRLGGTSDNLGNDDPYSKEWEIISTEVEDATPETQEEVRAKVKKFSQEVKENNIEIWSDFSVKVRKAYRKLSSITSPTYSRKVLYVVKGVEGNEVDPSEMIPVKPKTPPKKHNLDMFRDE